MSSRIATDQVRQHFASREADALQVLVPNVDPKAERDAIDKFARKLSVEPGVARVDAVTGYYHVVLGGATIPALPPDAFSKRRFASEPGYRGTYLSVVPDVEPLSAQGEKLVKDIRATPAPFHFLVAGSSAQLVDTKHVIVARLPIAIGIIALATFVLLFMMTGSILVPLKALAAEHALAHRDVRRDGVDLPGRALLRPAPLHADGQHRRVHADPHVLHRVRALDGLRGLPPVAHQGGVRPRARQRARDRRRVAEDGPDRHRRRAAADDRVRRDRDVRGRAGEDVRRRAHALAVLVDAFLIRATLVPAFMRLAGRVNWWSPKWLRRWHLRFGIWENEPIALLDREFETRVR